MQKCDTAQSKLPSLLECLYIMYTITMEGGWERITHPFLLLEEKMCASHSIGLHVTEKIGARLQTPKHPATAEL